MAVNVVAAKLQEAKQRQAHDIERSIGYLEAAREAIQGLELEAHAPLSKRPSPASATEEKCLRSVQS